mmetsp:Transcript_41164/g.129041  ORF Transcript_41164/g.129041 Transcript_41164/m.129041 type:complete len:116 (-) Transcript_41164:88-435(-)
MDLAARPGDAAGPYAAFVEWLDATLINPEVSDEDRLAAIVEWEKRAPGARDAHPREEHLAPLFVIAGAAAAPREGELEGACREGGVGDDSMPEAKKVWDIGFLLGSMSLNSYLFP